jgi:hypothetical protein
MRLRSLELSGSCWGPSRRCSGNSSAKSLTPKIVVNVRAYRIPAHGTRCILFHARGTSHPHFHNTYTRSSTHAAQSSWRAPSVHHSLSQPRCLLHHPTCNPSRRSRTIHRMVPPIRSGSQGWPPHDEPHSQPLQPTSLVSQQTALSNIEVDRQPLWAPRCRHQPRMAGMAASCQVGARVPVRKYRYLFLENAA